MRYCGFASGGVYARESAHHLVVFAAVLVAVWSCLSELSAQANATLPEGTAVQVRLTRAIGTELNEAGDRFEAILDQDLRNENVLVARAGSVLIGEVLEAEESGRVRGRARMALTLRELQIEGTTYAIETNTIVIEAEGTRGEDARVIGGSAGVGALLGAIIGGKRGAVIGATLGAGAGTTAVLVTDGKEVKFEPEQQFRFHLKETFRADSSQARTASGFGRPRDLPGRDSGQANVGNAIQNLSSRASALRSSVESSFASASQNSTDLRLYFLMSSLCDAVDLIDRRSTQNPSEESLSGEVVSYLQDQQEAISRELTRRQISGVLKNRWTEFEEGLTELLRISSSVRPGSDSADGSGTLSWRGYVDEEDFVILQDDSVQIQNSKGRPAWNMSYQLSGPLPRGPLQISLDQTAGRGRVEILERPSRWNDYRAIIRIADPESGSDYYMFTLDWVSEDTR